MTGLIVKMCLLAWPQAILETGLELIVTVTSLIHQICLLAWPKDILETGLEVLSVTGLINQKCLLAWPEVRDWPGVRDWPEVLRETGLKFSTGLDVGTWPIDRLELPATSGTAKLCQLNSTNFDNSALLNNEAFVIILWDFM